MKFLFFLSPQSFPITLPCLRVALLIGCYLAADNGPSMRDQSEAHYSSLLSFFSMSLLCGLMSSQSSTSVCPFLQSAFDVYVCIYRRLTNERKKQHEVFE